MKLQWRWERARHRIHTEDDRWSGWYGDKDACVRMAEDPDYGSGLIQKRKAPEKNPVTIEPYIDADEENYWSQLS